MLRLLTPLVHNRLTAAARAALRRKLLMSPRCSAVYLEHLIRREMVRVERLARRQEWSTVPFRSAAQLLADQQRSRRGDVCHVLASGWSALDGLDTIAVGRDTLYGFNFSAVAALPFDLYFIEIASSAPGRIADLSELQAQLVTMLRTGQIGRLYAKNFYGGYLQPEYLCQHYGSDLAVAMDIQLPSLPQQDSEFVRRQAMRALLRRRETCLVQYGSSTLTCIALAAQAGFRQIVVHGLDFSGQHFFSAGEFDLPQDFLGRLRRYYPPVAPGEFHGTGEYLMQLLPLLHAQLQEEGVALFAGSQRSPAARFLPVYRNSPATAQHDGVRIL